MNTEKLKKELIFKAVRSSGAGGQHVNKVSSKVVLFFDISQTNSFSEKEKETLLIKLKNRYNKNGVLIITSEETRSQLKNKEIVIKKFFKIIDDALKVNKVRKATKPKKQILLKRQDLKKQHALKKQMRKKPNI